MTTYRITAPHFVAAIVESGDAIIQSAPILHWAVGKQFSYVRDYCHQRGWIVEPLETTVRPHWLECDGKTYELKWHNNTLTRITLHYDGEVCDLRFDDLPDVLKGLL
jgi:hypothetical protein